MKQVLWVCPRWLNPINDGARQATDSLLKTTGLYQNVNIELDLLIWAETGLSTREKEVAILFFKKNYGLRNVFIETRFLSFLPVFWRKIIFVFASFILLRPATVLPFFSYKLSKSKFFFKSYDHLIFDAPHGALSILHHQTKCILRAHNLEAQIWHSEVQKSSGPMKFILAYQLFLMKKFEQSIVAAARTVACVSEQDRIAFKRFYNAKTAITIPIGYDFNLTKNIRDSVNLKIWGFLGRLDWPPNREGLFWFLKKVWPVVNASKGEAQLIIAGSGQCDTSLFNLIKSSPNVLFLGKIEHKDDFYKKVDGVVIPIFYGGGTRVKAIEAVQNRKLILSTRLGVQGLHLKKNVDYLQAETSEEWFWALTSSDVFVQSEMLTDNAFCKLKNIFDPQVFSQRWNDLLR
jgi:hypothetical protein